MKYLLVLLIFLMPLLSRAENISLNTNNSIAFRGEISDEQVSYFMEKLNELDSIRGTKDYPLYIVLDSPGGDIEAGLNFIQFARSIHNIKTITIFAASMASGIVEALPGERLITEMGTLMFHRAKGTFSGQFDTGEVESRLAYANQIVGLLENTNASRLGMSLKEYKAAVHNELWIFGFTSVFNNAADKVVSISCTKDLIDSKYEEQSAFSSVIYSKCPLFRVGKQNKNDNQLTNRRVNK